MQAAQNIIKSRTGNAIMKQAYGAADRQAEKKARLIEHKKGKELRKLALEKVQFIHEQDEKLKRKEAEKTRAKNSDGIQTILEIRIPSEKDFAKDENCKENLVSRRSPRTVRSSPRKEQCRTVGSWRQKESQPGEIFPTQIEDYELEYEENGEIILPVRIIREFNEEARRGRLPENEIELRTTNLYQDYADYDQITSWLNAVERQDPGHFQRTPRSGRKKNKKVQDGEVQAQLKEYTGLNTAKAAEDDKGFLKLPKINSNVESPISCRTKSFKRVESLDDPRFTNLLDSLTPVKNTTLELPKIPRSAECKSRASKKIRNTVWDSWYQLVSPEGRFARLQSASTKVDSPDMNSSSFELE